MARTKKQPKQLPNYTSGLECRLMGLLGEPILLAKRVVRKKFEQELSTNEGTYIRYTYHTQKSYTYIDYENLGAYLTYPPIHNLPHLMTHERRYNFRVDLWEDSDGKFRKFSFGLEAS